MKRNAMSLKAIINNIAKENKVSAQSVLQTYMLERLLERISISKYKDNFILKGGMLISAMLGIDSRTTMDIDTTIKGFKLTEENIINIIKANTIIVSTTKANKSKYTISNKTASIIAPPPFLKAKPLLCIGGKPHLLILISYSKQYSIFLLICLSKK